MFMAWISGGCTSIELRCGLAATTSLAVMLLTTPFAISWLSGRCRERIASDSARLNELHAAKQNTPTMGGLLIMVAVLLSLLVWSDLTVPTVQLSLFAMIGLTAIGVIDDWVKLRHNTKGLTARQKLVSQSVVALITAASLWGMIGISRESASSDSVFFAQRYYTLVHLIPSVAGSGWLILWSAVIIVGSSNAVNLTDGLDGLASGCALTTFVPLIIAAVVSSHVDVPVETLSLPELSRQQISEQAAILLSGMVGSLLGFLWFNRFPARIFMGDSGSLPIGGLLAFAALTIRQEFLLAIAGGIFVVETLSVILQVGWYKATQRRLIRCSPLHNHFVFLGTPEQTIVIGFWLVSLVLGFIAVAVLTFF